MRDREWIRRRQRGGEMDGAAQQGGMALMQLAGGLPQPLLLLMLEARIAGIVDRAG